MKNILIAPLVIFVINSSYGQTLRFDESLEDKTETDFSSYIASDGYEYKVGEKIKIGQPSTSGGFEGNKKLFAFISKGDGVFSPIMSVSSDWSGTESEILKIFVAGTSRTGYKVFMRTKAMVYRYRINFEEALKSGEIEPKGMTEETALKKLAQEKQKLDLGLITQDQYEKVKLELSKFIK